MDAESRALEQVAGQNAKLREHVTELEADKANLSGKLRDARDAVRSQKREMETLHNALGFAKGATAGESIATTSLRIRSQMGGGGGGGHQQQPRQGGFPPVNNSPQRQQQQGGSPARRGWGNARRRARNQVSAIDRMKRQLNAQASSFNRPPQQQQQQRQQQQQQHEVSLNRQVNLGYSPSANEHSPDRFRRENQRGKAEPKKQRKKKDDDWFKNEFGMARQSSVCGTPDCNESAVLHSYDLDAHCRSVLCDPVTG